MRELLSPDISPLGCRKFTSAWEFCNNFRGLVRYPAMRDPAIRVILLPRDTNAVGSIFGGAILSQLDLAGVVEARKHARKNFVTVCMRQVEFKQPVYVGDVVSF